MQNEMYTEVQCEYRNKSNLYTYFFKQRKRASFCCTVTLGWENDIFGNVIHQVCVVIISSYSFSRAARAVLYPNCKN